MPTSQLHQILKRLQSLKDNRTNYSSEQYLKELKLLKVELDTHLSNPNLSKTQMTNLLRLLANA